MNKIFAKNIHIIMFLIGALIFLIIFGYEVVIPSNIDWLLIKNSDSGQHFLGWHFFRIEEWRLPLGYISKYHSPEGTCLTYMDSIPLLAIPLKLLNDILPPYFQYLGFWIILNYMLQGFFASLLLRKITSDWKLIGIGSIFFILSPIMLLRVGAHQSLSTHWLILAALYLYFSKDTKKIYIKWLLLILASSMIHFYLLVIVLGIWFGSLIRDILEKREDEAKVLNAFSITIIILVFNMWLIGYFSIPLSNTQNGGFGLYSMNILAPFIPSGGGETFFLPKIELATPGQYEGYNYLGFGVLMLATIAIFKSKKLFNQISWKNIFPLLLIFFILYILSLSEGVTFGNKILLNLNYPEFLKKLGNILRSSGRMFWPIYYFIVFISITTIIKSFKPKISFIILYIALIIQIIDLHPWYSTMKPNNNFNNTLKSKEWQDIAKHVKHIVTVPPTAFSHNYDIAFYAANNSLDINTGYVARENTKLRKNYYMELIESLKNNKLKEDTLYIIKKTNLIYPSIENRRKFIFGKLDGYYIIVPRYK